MEKRALNKIFSVLTMVMMFFVMTAVTACSSDDDEPTLTEETIKGSTFTVEKIEINTAGQWTSLDASQAKAFSYQLKFNADGSGSRILNGRTVDQWKTFSVKDGKVLLDNRAERSLSISGGKLVESQKGGGMELRITYKK